jgi:hypothetical protein
MRRHITQFTGKKEPHDYADKESGGLNCSAHGCPLVGAISRSTAGGNWRCWAHDSIDDPFQWPAITEGINENLWLFRVAERVATMPPYELETQKAEEIANYLKSRGRKDLCRLKNDGAGSDRVELEPRPYWSMRLRHAAFAAAMGKTA